MIWRTKTGDIDLSKRALIMGILNVTVDSFSDGGKFLGVENAAAHAREMSAQGAEIIDIGGESTRPGAEPVAADEEMARVMPVITRMKDEGRRMKRDAAKFHHSSFLIHPCPFISIDTSKPAVASAAIKCGACIINDVTGLRDLDMIEVARKTGAGVIVMHMQGTPRDMQRNPHYDDVVAEVRDFFRQSFDRAVACGIDPMSIAFDPGIGFGKTVAHNLSLLKNLASLRVADRPLVIGVSRKSFLSAEGGTRNAEVKSGEDCSAIRVSSSEFSSRFWPTVALTSFARENGANILRVHDVKANVEALRMTEAILKK